MRAKGTFGFGSLLSWIGLGKAEIETEIEGQTKNARNTSSDKTITLKPIRTPQRQLIQLTAHYLVASPNRFFLIDDVTDRTAGDKGWWQTPVISEVPRALAFLNLPSADEVEATKGAAKPLSHTKLIPVAAEFTNGTVVTYFDKLGPKPGTAGAPGHPDIENPATYRQNKKAYWQWYVDNSAIQRSMELIERSVQEQKCRIQWIDFRVPISADGETQHLHVVGGGRYDTITFAYNFIRRGYEFGLRLVGTLKTDPDLNVLAIYER